MKSKVKNILNILLVALCFTSLGVSAATFINSKDVIYDNSISGLKSTNVQSAVDELYSAATDYSSLNQRILTLENDTKNVINKIYPVGSIYISATDDTVEKVKERFGGEWERYAEGRTLIGVGTGTDSNGTVKIFNVNDSSGEYTHILTIAEMPSHNHVQFGVIALSDTMPEKWKYFTRLGSGTDYIGSTSDRQTFATGGSGAHNNIQPYITTYMYKRIK